MGAVADAISAAFRDFVTAGSPASGPNPVAKSEVRSLGAVIENFVSTAVDALTAAVATAQSTANAATNTIALVSKTGNFTVAAADKNKRFTIIGSGAITVNLPALSGVTDGDRYYFGNAGLFKVTIDPAASDTIDGGASVSVLTELEEGVLIKEGGAWVWLHRPRMILIARDERVSGTSAGSVTANSDNIRTLQTTKKNGIGGASLASNAIQLPPGSYKVEGWGTGYGNTAHTASIVAKRTSDDVVIATLSGSSEKGLANMAGRSQVEGAIVSALPIYLEFHHQFVSAAATGMGLANGIAGATEVFASVTVEKLG